MKLGSKIYFTLLFTNWIIIAFLLLKTLCIERNPNEANAISISLRRTLSRPPLNALFSIQRLVS